MSSAATTPQRSVFVNTKQETNPAPPSQQPGHQSFRRQRASRACETCHSRKVRCDAASLGVPCTNCVAFNIECRIPTAKRKRATHVKSEDSQSPNGDGDHEYSQLSPGERDGSLPTIVHSTVDIKSPPMPTNTPAGTPVANMTHEQAAQAAEAEGTYVEYMRPQFARAPIKDAGRVAFLGESSNLNLLVQDRHGTVDVVHYPLPDTVRGIKTGQTELDSIEIEILTQRGAFLLPPRALCDELIEAFFVWVAPVVPVISRTTFMRHYNDPKNPPSLLLLQAMLLAGSRVCTNPQLMDANGSTTPAATTFYKRAKALYDANYEDDRVTIVQALILMGWYWEGPEDVTKNVFYWSRVAIVVAQGSGMHRSVEKSALSRADKRLWKRIWWTLFTRDRSVAVALGRPVHINTDDSDVELLTEDDFIEEDFPDRPTSFPPDPVAVQFFLQYVKLCEIMELVLSQQYSVASKRSRHPQLGLTQCDMTLADWLQNCPPIVGWEQDRHHFLPALLHQNYYTTLTLLHRAHMPAAQMNSLPGQIFVYPSRTIAFTAATMVTKIIESLRRHGELRRCPAFIVYSLFSALIMHVYELRVIAPEEQRKVQRKIDTCLEGLEEVSKTWAVAKMVHTLFLSILGNKTLGDKFAKAAGRRHKTQVNAPFGNVVKHDTGPVPEKRKFDDMAFNSYGGGPPAAQISFERSRPQTPKPPDQQPAGPGGTGGFPMGYPTMMPPVTQPQPQPQMQFRDAFMGVSRTNTRPATPFNPSFSIPGSPPDLFLATKNSPPISQNIWENFQPDQLFPEGSANNASLQYSMPQPLDPILMGQPVQSHEHMSGLLSPQQQQQQHHQQPHSSPRQNLSPGQHNIPQLNVPMSPRNGETSGPDGTGGGDDQMRPWDAMDDLQQQQQQQQQQQHGGQMNSGHSPDAGSSGSGWSGSQSGIVPTTLNVEDWYQFFGLNDQGLGNAQGAGGQGVGAYGMG